MSGLKGRRISADMFAMMLKVPVGELVLQPDTTSRYTDRRYLLTGSAAGKAGARPPPPSV